MNEHCQYNLNGGMQDYGFKAAVSAPCFPWANARKRIPLNRAENSNSYHRKQTKETKYLVS